MNEVDNTTGCIFLSLSSITDKKLVADLLGKNYSILSKDHDVVDENIDLIVVDFPELNRLYDRINYAKKKTGINYLPVMVMIANHRSGSDKMWNIADDVVEMPVGKKNLLTRINGLIKIRNFSRQAQEKQRKLEQKNRQLQLYYNAIDATTSGLVIADPSKEDMPIIFCNNAFTVLTGYSESEVIGRNCRFLQGDDRDQPARAVIRNAIERKETCKVILRNYRKDGSLFWNELKISPIFSDNGEVEYFVGIQNDITELINTQKALKSSKDQWEGIVSQSPNLILVSIDGVIQFVNEVGAHLQGFDHPDEAIGKSIYDLHPESEFGILKNRLKKLNKGVQTPPMVYTMVDNKGNTRYVKVQSIPITYNGQKAAQTVGVDVTQLKESEIELTALLKQKEVLLQEIHHRVKNNLAIISSLIELQTASIDNEEAISYLQDTQMRIISIAKVHEMLYRQESLHELEFDRYIEQLVEKIESTVVLKEQDINIDVEMHDVKLSLDQAISCGLLLNELITNSIQHGFDEDETIKINISAKEEDGRITIRYRDYGKGMSETPDLATSGNFGSMIIMILIKQLNADYTLEARGGMQMTFSFKRAEYRGPSTKFS